MIAHALHVTNGGPSSGSGGDFLFFFCVDDSRFGGRLILHHQRAERFPRGCIDYARLFELVFLLEAFDGIFGLRTEVAIGANIRAIPSYAH